MIGNLGLSSSNSEFITNKSEVKPDKMLALAKNQVVSIRNGTPNTLDIYGWDTTLQFNVNNVYLTNTKC